jgi:hypothetical protein
MYHFQRQRELLDYGDLKQQCCKEKCPELTYKFPANVRSVHGTERAALDSAITARQKVN